MDAFRPVGYMRFILADFLNVVTVWKINVMGGGGAGGGGGYLFFIHMGPDRQYSTTLKLNCLLGTDFAISAHHFSSDLICITGSYYGRTRCVLIPFLSARPLVSTPSSPLN